MDFNADRQQYHFLLIMMMFYYQLGTALERAWGTFRFNVYIFGGMIFTVIGAFVLYGIYLIYLFMGGNFAYTASYNDGTDDQTSILICPFPCICYLIYPDMQVLLYFIIPIKMKWMAAVYVVIMVFSVWDTYHAIYAYTVCIHCIMVCRDYAVMYCDVTVKLSHLLPFHEESEPVYPT